MKKLILIVLMFSSVLGVKAQDTTRWRLDDPPYHGVWWGFDFDSLGGIYHPYFNYEMHHLDSTGTMTQNYPIHTKMVFQHSDENLYGIVGYIPNSPFNSTPLFHYEGDSLYKMDTNGVLQWKVPFSAGFIAPGAGTDFYTVRRDSVFEDVANNAGVNTDVIFSKLDSSANVVWQDTIKSIGANSWVEVYGVKSNKRGDLVMHGFFEDSIQIGGIGLGQTHPFVQHFLLLTDSSGNLIWIRTGLDSINNGVSLWHKTKWGQNYAINEQGKVYYLSEYSLFELGYDSSFSVLKSYTSYLTWNIIELDTSGKLVVVGYGSPLDTVSNSYPNGTYLTSIDTMGNILWEGVFGGGVSEFDLGTPIQIKVDNYNNLIVNVIGGGSARLVPDDSLFLPPISMNIMLSVQEMAVYPNPFSSVLNLSYELETVADVELSLYDILGKKYDLADLVEQSGEQSAGTHELSVNTASLPSGTYFLRIRVGDAVEHRKLLKL